jgi:hypothetical protein
MPAASIGDGELQGFGQGDVIACEASCTTDRLSDKQNV